MSTASRGPYKNRKALYEKARALRREGLGYRTIAAELNGAVPWGTIASWVNDIPADARKSYEAAMAIERAKRPLHTLKRKESIRRRYIEERGHRCEACGLTNWRDGPLWLEMHRMGGSASAYTDPANIQLLCLNCHAQTTGYRNTKYPSRDSNPD